MAPASEEGYKCRGNRGSIAIDSDIQTGWPTKQLSQHGDQSLRMKFLFLSFVSFYLQCLSCRFLTQAAKKGQDTNFNRTVYVFPSSFYIVYSLPSLHASSLPLSQQSYSFQSHHCFY